MTILYYLKEFFCVTLLGNTELYFAQNYVFLGMFLVALAFLVWKRNDYKAAFGLLGIYTILQLVIIIYNPILIPLFNKIPGFEGEKVFARFWLMVPVWIIIAYVLAVLISRLKNKIIEYVVAVAVAAVLIYTGDSVRSLDMFNDARCAYKVRPESIAIVDEMLSITGGEPTSLYMFVPEYDVADNYVDGGTIYYGILQYTGLIYVSPHPYPTWEWEDYLIPEYCADSDILSQSYIHSYFIIGDTLGCEYLAMPDDERINYKIDNLGYELMGQAGGYNIYRIESGI